MYPRAIAAAVCGTDDGALLLGITTVAAHDVHDVVPGARTFVAARILRVALRVATMVVAPMCDVSHGASKPEHHVKTTTNLDCTARQG